MLTKEKRTKRKLEHKKNIIKFFKSIKPRYKRMKARLCVRIQSFFHRLLIQTTAEKARKTHYKDLFKHIKENKREHWV